MFVEFSSSYVEEAEHIPLIFLKVQQ